MKSAQGALLVTLFFIGFDVDAVEKPTAPRASNGEKVKIAIDEKFGEETTTKILAPKEMGDEASFSVGVSTKKIGVLESGKYKGLPLLLARFVVDFDGPCYPVSACGGDLQYQRFIKTEKEMVLISKASLSTPPWGDGGYGAVGKNPLAGVNPFKDLKLNMTSDADTELAGFGIPKEIVFNNDPRMRIEFLYETDALYESKFGKFDKVNSAWNVFNLKAIHSKASETFKRSYASKAIEFEQRIRNFFYVKKPDGTFSIYKYSPDIYQDNRISKKFDFAYTHQASIDCSGRPADFIDVIENVMGEKNLAMASSTFNGDLLYYPPDGMLKELFKVYKNTSSEYVNGEDKGSSQKDYSNDDEPETLKDFKKMTPMLIWKSPLGQWIRFVRVRFLQPIICD